MSESVLPMLSSKSFIVSGLTFRSLIHLSLFLCMVLEYRNLGAGALGWPRGMVWGGRWEEGSGWGTHVYLWWIHFDMWQNQYNIVKLRNKIKLNLKKEFKIDKFLRKFKD